MKNKYENLSDDEKIKKYKNENKILLISGIICSVVIIFISILFFIFDLDKKIAISFILMLPFSWYIGYYIPKKENDRKINDLEK